VADLAIILTVRSDSERFKDKCFLDIRNKPLVYWIIKRLQKIKSSQVVLATTHLRSDDRLVEIAEAMKIPVYRGDSRDVVARVDNAMREHVPDCKLVLRALADMPFISYKVVDRACEVLLKYNKEAILWHLPPDIWPVYGAREFPYSRSGWAKIVRSSIATEEREHTDMYFHRNRRRFNILYHEPPPSDYFRPYRLEVDWEEDGELIQSIGGKIGMLKPLTDVIRYLDKNPDVASLNREKIEKTGVSSYEYQQQRIWMALMRGQPELDWDDKWWRPMNGEQVPQFCHRGHLLGYAQYGVLYTRDGETQIEAGKIKCQAEGCGSSKYWHLAKERKVRGDGGY
jgi:spore coat polysaccharide biosynthesis protein SpsF